MKEKDDRLKILLGSGGIFAVIVAAVVGTYTITTLATTSYIKSLQLQANILNSRVVELQNEVVILQKKLDIANKKTPKPAEDERQSVNPDNSKELSIVFLQPINGMTVSQFIDIQYSITGVVPEGYKPILVVRDPLGQYWSWGTSPSGRYSRVQMGIVSDNEKQFEIGVLITNYDFPIGQPTMSLPEGILYKSISVTRK